MDSTIAETPPAETDTDGNLHRLVQSKIKDSNRGFSCGTARAVPEPVTIRVGKAGGLCFDTLSTDVVIGCLPANLACFGTCFAALGAYKAGYDFGRRVPNHFDPDVVRSDLAALPADQGYVRNGWNSDPSWDWEKAIAIAELVHQSGRTCIFISKCFNIPTPEQVSRLIGAGAELRLSISAFDNQTYLARRFEFMQSFRSEGGSVIALVVTALFKNPKLQLKQREIVAHLVDNDFLAAENSLRVNRRARILEWLDVDQMAEIEGGSDLWAGRLFCDELRVPTTTSVPITYRGMQSPFLSRNDPAFIKSLFHDPVPTRADVQSGVPQNKPKMCGIDLRGSAT